MERAWRERRSREMEVREEEEGGGEAERGEVWERREGEARLETAAAWERAEEMDFGTTTECPASETAEASQASTWESRDLTDGW